MPLSNMKHMLIVLQNIIFKEKKRIKTIISVHSIIGLLILLKNIKGNNARMQLKPDFVQMFQD